MKKFLKKALLGVAVLPAAFMLTACDSEPTDPINISKATVTLGYTQVDYDGNEKEPEVVIAYDGERISKEHYKVEYLNNVEAGTAAAIVSASRESDELVGSVVLYFNIRKSNAMVNTYNKLTSALANDNYKAAVLTTNITVPAGKKLEIDEDDVVHFGNYTIANYGTIENEGTIITRKPIEGNGVIENTGNIEAHATDVDSMLAAFEYADTIVLDNDIKKQDGYLGDIHWVVAEGRPSYKFTLDLNGHAVESELDIFDCVNHGNNTWEYRNTALDITITDTSILRTGCLGSNESDYGLYVRCNNSNQKITIKNVTLKGQDGGLYTNGGASADVVIEAQNSRFIGTDNVGGFGAYVVANYTYIYTNCEFTGLDGYYTKSGKHIFNSCSFYANGAPAVEEHFGNGAYSTGSGINVDSSTGYHQVLQVTVNGGFIKSNGYGIYEFSTAKQGETKISYGTVTVTPSVVFNTVLANIQSNNDVVNK